MKDLKLELFNFKKSLSIDQDDVNRIVEQHLNYCNEYSEKQVIISLNERLKTYAFDKEVKVFVESLNTDLTKFSVLYELKDLYSSLNKQNQGELYRQPINVILQAINLDNEQDRVSKVLNELSVYDWVPEIKGFVYNLTKSPEQRSNILNSGTGESLYTIVEQVEEGHLAYIKDSWFILSEGLIEKTLLENHVKDEERFNTLRSLQTAMNWSTISESRIDFRISENLTIGIGVDKKGIFINEDLLEGDTTLENLFSSPIIPIVNKNFYPLLMEVSKNVDSFVELDIVKKITNMIKPTLEMYVFNYKDNNYIYRCDQRYGNSLFKFESALEILNEVKNELNYDLTYLFENKLTKEIVTKKKLEDKEREVELKLEDINFNISKIKGSIKLIGESVVLKTALKNLESRKLNLNTELEAIKELQYKERIKI